MGFLLPMSKGFTNWVDGEPVPTDAYIFLLEVTCDGGKKGKRWGDVSLVR